MWRADIGTSLRAVLKAVRVKQATATFERLEQQSYREREHGMLLEIQRMLGAIAAAVEKAVQAKVQAGVGDPEGAGYRALDAAGFRIKLWDIERDEMREFTSTCCATDDGFTWSVCALLLGLEPAPAPNDRTVS